MQTEQAMAKETEHRNPRLLSLLQRHCHDDYKQASQIPGVTLFHGTSTDKASCTISNPVFAFMAQGEKRIWVGEDEFLYDPRHYLVSTVEMPMFAQVTKASPEKPYYGCAVELDPMKIVALDNQLLPAQRGHKVARAMAVGTLSEEISEAAYRLVALLDTPDSIPLLAPLREQELLYHLLCGPMGSRLRDVMMSGSHSHQIAGVMDWIKANLSTTMSVEEMAEQANMSKSSFHQHFKSLTSMTPLQYQKQLRLQEARHLMLVQELDAAGAAYAVGYESPSQFSREYRRMFGESPARDIAMISTA